MPEFKKVKFSIILDSPEDTEIFIQGLVLAKQNNNSHYWEEILEVCNNAMTDYREAVLNEQLEARREAGMP